jgi:cytochrome c biogenesis protein CcmG/thiol:disulfide interchange protein DsbE
VKLHATLAVAAAILLAGGCSSWGDGHVKAAPIKESSKRNNAPDFSLRDVDGKLVKLSDFRGKVVLVDFWATWCGPCKIMIPWFIDLERKHKDKGFAVIGVSMDDEGWDVVKPFLSRMNVNYRVVIGTDPVAQSYGGIEALPTTFLIDREGRIAATHVGLTSRKEFENGVEQLLGIGSAQSGIRPRGRLSLPAFALGTE